MKVREVLKFTDENLPGIARSVAVDRFSRKVAPVHVPNRIGSPQEHTRHQDIFPDADPNDGGLPARDQPATTLVAISTPHSPDLECIKARIARLPRRTEQ